MTTQEHVPTVRRIVPKFKPSFFYGDDSVTRYAMTFSFKDTTFVCSEFTPVTSVSMFSQYDHLYIKESQYDFWLNNKNTYVLVQDWMQKYYYAYEETYFLLMKGVLI